MLQNVVLQLAFRTSKPAAEDCAADSTLGTNRNGQESQCCPPPSAFRLILTAGAGALGRCSPGLEMELRLRWAVRSRLLCTIVRRRKKHPKVLVDVVVKMLKNAQQ